MDNPKASMEKLGKSKFFSKIDLSKGYWHIPVEIEYKENTAFVVLLKT